MRKILAVLALLLLVASLTLTGCGTETTVGKVPRGEGDLGEGEPCRTDDDCDEIGEICVSGVCIYED